MWKVRVQEGGSWWRKSPEGDRRGGLLRKSTAAQERKKGMKLTDGNGGDRFGKVVRTSDEKGIGSQEVINVALKVIHPHIMAASTVPGVKSLGEPSPQSWRTLSIYFLNYRMLIGDI